MRTARPATSRVREGSAIGAGVAGSKSMPEPGPATRRRDRARRRSERSSDPRPGRAGRGTLEPTRTPPAGVTSQVCAPFDRSETIAVRLDVALTWGKKEPTQTRSERGHRKEPQAI